MKVPKMPGTRTLVKPSDRETTESGILHLPDIVRGVSALEGTIVAVGPDCETARVGDEVVLAPYSKYVVPAFEGPYNNHLIVNEEDILFYWADSQEGDK